MYKIFGKRFTYPQLVKLGFISFIGTIFFLPLLAPILSHFGHKKIAGWIYKIYSFTCHQKAHRSMFIYDEQCAWCMRDTFIWAAILMGSIIVFYGKQVPGVTWKIACLLMLPMALDGSIQLIGTFQSMFYGVTPFYESTNTLRALTGALFGIGFVMLFLPRLRGEIDALPGKPQNKV